MNRCRSVILNGWSAIFVLMVQSFAQRVFLMSSPCWPWQVCMYLYDLVLGFMLTSSNVSIWPHFVVSVNRFECIIQAAFCGSCEVVCLCPSECISWSLLTGFSVFFRLRSVVCTNRFECILLDYTFWPPLTSLNVSLSLCFVVLIDRYECVLETVFCGPYWQVWMCPSDCVLWSLLTGMNVSFRLCFVVLIDRYECVLETVFCGPYW